MKLRIAILSSLLLVGCQQLGSDVIDELEKTQPQYTSTIEPEINEEWIESEIIYIESLIGIGEINSARLYLNDLLFTINGEVNNQLQQARINTMIILLEDLSFEEDIEEHQHVHGFTGADAVAIAMNYYDVDSDIIFMYHEIPSYFGEDQVGFYVALKSRTLLESDNGSDGIVMKIFVSSDGQIQEIKNQN